MKYLIEQYRKEFENINHSHPFKREMFNNLKNKIINSNICLVGLRQVGKTTLMLQLAKYYYDEFINKQINDNQLLDNVLNNMERVLYLNIKSLQDINSKDSYDQLRREVINKKYKLILLDEIQELNDWTNFLQTVIDLNSGARFIVSGSNATSLTKETMVGRMKTYFIKPLLFKEYKKIWKDDNLDNYLKFGSYPKNKNYSNCFVQYNELINEIIIDKIIYDDNKKNVDSSKFWSLLKDINNCVGNETNISQLESKSITRQTISEYLKMMRNSQLIHFVPKYSDKNAKRKNKIYYEDKSMINYFNSFEKLNNNLLGSLIENAVFSHLNYLYMSELSLNQIFYFRNEKQNEIDFVLPNQKLLIECKYIKNINVEEVSAKFYEIIENNKEFRNFKKIVITQSTNTEFNDVKFISLDKFLEEEHEW